MCMLWLSQKREIREALEKFLDNAGMFTVRDFISWCEENYYGAKDFSRREVSSYIRELFNGGECRSVDEYVFNSWACVKTNGNDGPLLFFNLTMSMDEVYAEWSRICEEVSDS